MIMNKQTRKQRKEEERRILAELDEALAEEKQSKAPTENDERRYVCDGTQPERIHCRRCKTLMEKGVCPTCGYRIYTPMSEAQRKKTRGIVAVVCIGVFVVLFFALRLWK